MEGFEVAIAALLQKMSICEFYAGIYLGVSLPLQSTNSPQLQNIIDSALPELYSAVIVFSVKARDYFGKKFTATLKSFDVEFQPFIEDINSKERAIREYADAATMERIRSMILHLVLDSQSLSNATIQTLKVSFRILHQK